jgi:nicotinate-nucleotide adenylyltransferase
MVSGWLLWTRRSEQVWLVPVFRHAFEGVQDKVMAPFERRMRWCEAMAEDIDRVHVSVSRIEANLKTPSFTIDTLRSLGARHPEHRFRLVVGADVLPQTPQWKAWDDIVREFEPIVVGRANHPPVSGSPQFPDVSSTEIRRRLQNGEAVDHLVTSRVAALLAER